MYQTNCSAIVRGCLTWFEPKAADAQRLYSALELLGKEFWAPSPETPPSALQHALADYGRQLATERRAADGEKHAFQVEARADKKQDGFELLDITRRSGPNGYTCECTVRVKDDDRLDCVTGYVPMYELQESYDRYRRTATGAAVGRSLVDLTKHLHGTCVRLGGGGVYYLPEDAVTEWHDVIDAFEQCSGTKVNRMRVVMDDLAARAIRDGIVSELVKEAAEIADQLRAGDLQESVVARRKQRSQELRAKAREYETILADTLTEVHQVLDLADTCAAAAIATQEDTAVFDAAFA